MKPAAIHLLDPDHPNQALCWAGHPPTKWDRIILTKRRENATCKKCLKIDAKEKE